MAKGWHGDSKGHREARNKALERDMKYSKKEYQPQRMKKKEEANNESFSSLIRQAQKGDPGQHDQKKYKVTIKVSRVERRNPQFWSDDDMFTGELYDVYIDNQIVVSHLLEDEDDDDYFEYGQDSIKKDVEVYKYESIKDYEDAQWFLEDDINTSITRDAPGDLILRAQEEKLTPYQVTLMD